jgi:hypothetical protein
MFEEKPSRELDETLVLCDELDVAVAEEFVIIVAAFSSSIPPA